MSGALPAKKLDSPGKAAGNEETAAAGGEKKPEQTKQPANRREKKYCVIEPYDFYLAAVYRHSGVTDIEGH